MPSLHRYPTLVRAHVRGSTLDPTVTDALQRYFTARPDERACEAAAHGYDPLSAPSQYLAEELAEPDHAALRAEPLTAQTIQEWEQQETAEHTGHTVAKDGEPGSSDVHVDVPLGNDAPAKRKRKKPPPPVDDTGFSVLKADQEQRLVYGIVLDPDVEDSQGDIVSKDDVELAAHRYVYQNIRPDIIGDQHRGAAPPSVRPVESYIAPCDFELGGQQVKKGSWVLVGKIDDDQLWQQVKEGHKGAWSVGGSGKRNPLPAVVAKDSGLVLVRPVKDEDAWTLVDKLAGLVAKAVGREPAAPAPVHVHFNAGAFQGPHVETHNHLPEQEPPVVNVAAAEPAEVHAHVSVEPPAARSVRVEVDADGAKRYVPE